MDHTPQCVRNAASPKEKPCAESSLQPVGRAVRPVPKHRRRLRLPPAGQVSALRHGVGYGGNVRCSRPAWRYLALRPQFKQALTAEDADLVGRDTRTVVTGGYLAARMGRLLSLSFNLSICAMGAATHTVMTVSGSSRARRRDDRWKSSTS